MRYSLRGLTATAAIALLAPVAAQAQDKKPLTFGELQTIRVMAGGMVGEALGQALGKNMLGIIANRSAICSTLSGGVGSGFLRTNAKGAITMESIREAVDVTAAVERMLPADALYLAFGGEWKKEDNVALLEKTLEELAVNQYKGTIVFHVTTWAQKQPQEIAARNPRVAAYLRQADIRVGTLNLDAKKAVLNKATLEGDQWKLTPIGEVPMRDDLVALFRRA
ncbi:hypothetical protein [Tepidimonas charontis]|uniref:Uncharacterized protein n=2 Tax=Tepidimonas TaxID=114248 RepID=A0A554X200_9BURK|nr:hypothetical protein [Tepidimonas charontis]TSE29823.1 hypothetical protein Ttaiw_02156 [Tepidimonas taiwanensis]TSE32612.1 hypothetical protein Tchar_02056 [Tepidimonas charontis]